MSVCLNDIPSWNLWLIPSSTLIGYLLVQLLTFIQRMSIWRLVVLQTPCCYVSSEHCLTIHYYWSVRGVTWAIYPNRVTRICQVRSIIINMTVKRYKLPVWYDPLGVLLQRINVYFLFNSSDLREKYYLILTVRLGSRGQLITYYSVIFKHPRRWT